VVITVLSGGVGAARLLRALSDAIDPGEITAIVNVGDDLVLHGLTICPDLDTINYTLAGLNNDELGWGLQGESWRVMRELDALGGAVRGSRERRVRAGSARSR
jgi:LPPG:FO 2-phospho-L-lactate transferase